MTQTVRLKWVLWVATVNALFALASGGLVVHGLRSAQAVPPPVQQVSCPAPKEPDPQLAQTLQLLAAGQQAMMIRALQPAPAPPAAAAPPAAKRSAARRSARRPRRLRPVCRAKQ